MKAEKFIKDYTKHCSNVLCAVEDKYGKKVISYREWLTPDQALSAVEIAREELKNKICNWTDEDEEMFLDVMHDFDAVEGEWGWGRETARDWLKSIKQKLKGE